MNLCRKYGDICQDKEDVCIQKIDETKMYMVRSAYRWLINDVKGEDEDVYNKFLKIKSLPSFNILHGELLITKWLQVVASIGNVL